VTWHSATLVACRPQHTAWSLLMTSLTRSQAAQLARGMLACATRRHARPQHPPLTALSLTALPSPLSCAGACRPLGASAQGSRPAACPQLHHAQRHALNCITPSTGAGGVGASVMLGSCYAASRSPRAALAAARVPCELASMRRPCCAAPRSLRGAQAAAWVLCGLACMRRPCCAAARAAASHFGSRLGTLRAHMHAQTLLCTTTAVASHSGSGLGTLRARMHAQALLCCSAVTARRLGSGVGTLRARMQAQPLLCCSPVTAGCPGSGMGTLRFACTRRP